MVMLKSDIRTIAMLIPRSCWSWMGSLAMREVSEPTELEA